MKPVVGSIEAGVAKDAGLARNTALVVLALVLMRLVAAAVTPLTFDEAYYWTWSKHLASGYYDHPPMVALVIRFGTLLAGDSELGVRLFSILLALPMSYAVYRAAEILFGGARVGATAAISRSATSARTISDVVRTRRTSSVIGCHRLRQTNSPDIA